MTRRTQSLLAAAAVVILSAVGLWLARMNGRGGDAPVTSAPTVPATQPVAGPAATQGRPGPGHTLQAPDPNRRFRDLTPEQRVKLARQPHGVGG